MKIVALIARILLGLLFVVFGLNGFLHFIPQPPMPPGDVTTFFTVLTTSGYMMPVFALQLIGGALLLVGRFNCRIFVLENTAVKIKKKTRITIMSIIGTMLRSSRP